MKTKTLSIAIALITVLFSCNSNTGEKGAGNQTNANKISSKEDSINKIKEIELVQLRQDSIDNLKIKGYSIKKLSGKDRYDGVTKIEYQSLIQLLDETRKTSEKEMWTKEKLQSTLNEKISTCKGGEVKLYIERNSIGSAETKWFSIIIKDLSEKELFRVDLENEIPVYITDKWVNISYYNVDKRIKAPFYVYIIDKLEEAPFKFEVTELKK